jgi:DNA-binding PadR family transcriptional regulator
VKELEGKLTAELRRGVLQIAILALMRRPTYGYQLGKDLAASGLETEEGTLYPILRRLEDQGLCESTWDTGGTRPRKYYQTTEKGRVTLDNLLGAFRRIAIALDDVISESGEKDE